MPYPHLKDFNNSHCLLNRDQTPSLAKWSFVTEPLAETQDTLSYFQFSKTALPSLPSWPLNMLRMWPGMPTLIPFYLEGLLILQDSAQTSLPERLPDLPPEAGLNPLPWILTTPLPPCILLSNHLPHWLVIDCAMSSFWKRTVSYAFLYPMPLGGIQ